MIYVQVGLLPVQLPAADHCGECHRRLRDPQSRDRGYGPDCWAEKHPGPPRMTRRGAWWLPQTGPGLIDVRTQPANVDPAVRDLQDEIATLRQELEEAQAEVAQLGERLTRWRLIAAGQTVMEADHG